jgi:hypothetical protein
MNERSEFVLDKATIIRLHKLALAKAARVIEGARLPPPHRARSKLAKQLVLIYLALSAVKSLHPKTTIKALNSQLSALQKQLQTVSAALDKSPELGIILTAAERDIAACNATPSGDGTNLVSELKQTASNGYQIAQAHF